MAQQLRVTTPLLEDPGLIPNTNMVLHLTPGDTVPSSGLFRHCMHVVQKHMQENVHTHKNRNKCLKAHTHTHTEPRVHASVVHILSLGGLLSEQLLNNLLRTIITVTLYSMYTAVRSNCEKSFSLLYTINMSTVFILWDRILMCH